MLYSRVILLAIVLLSFISNSTAEVTKFSLMGWVGLWNEEMVEWAENENRIYKLCPKSMSSDSYEKCRRNNLAKKTWIIQAYKSPSNTSEKAGEIIISVKPGDPFVSSFKNNEGTIRYFEPDLYDQDWGNGPFFHQTILERKGDWIKIPIKALIAPVWVNFRDSIKYLDIITITEGIVYTLDSESIVITKIKGVSVFFRIEHESDMWCNTGSPPKLNESEVKIIHIQELYDTQKHLKLDIKYKRGC